MDIDHLEDAPSEVLARLDQFYTEVREVLAEALPVGIKLEKLRQLREETLRDIEALIHNFNRMAEVKESELMHQMARLQQLRDQVTVIRREVLPLFAYGPPED